jgi:hypothetical protein
MPAKRTVEFSYYDRHPKKIEGTAAWGFQYIALAIKIHSHNMRDAAIP